MKEQNQPAVATTRRDLLKMGGVAAVGSVAAGALATGGAAGAAVTSSVFSHAGFVSTNRFSFEIDGVLIAGVHTIDGLESDTDTSVGPTGPATNLLSVSADLAFSSPFFKWRKAVLDGKVDRRSISVIFHNDAGAETGRMNFFNCWPCKWTGPSLNSSAKSSAHATERLEISWETMEMKAG